jgi:hypothetical protein
MNRSRDTKTIRIAVATGNGPLPVGGQTMAAPA